METKNNPDYSEPRNDGENQGHHWERHERHQETHRMTGDKENQDDQDEETVLPEWGDIDPQGDPLIPPGPMDPSGPGSAV